MNKLGGNVLSEITESSVEEVVRKQEEWFSVETIINETKFNYLGVRRKRVKEVLKRLEEDGVIKKTGPLFRRCH